MKTVWFGFALSLVATGAMAQASVLPPRVDQLAQQYTADGYPALIIAVVDGDRSEVRAYGKLDGGKSPDGNTLFEIGSVSKTFTATLLANEVVKGRLTLDTPVASLLPGYTVPSRNGKRITLGNLASQNSGLPRLPGNLGATNLQDPYADYDADKMKTFLASYALTRDPGEQYEYSNLGVGLLGYALGVHAGSNYQQLLQKEIFKPLSMDHSTSIEDASVRAQLAVGHDADGKPVSGWNLNVLAGAGGIVSTGNDMLRYLKANMGVIKSGLYPAMQLAQTPRADGPSPDQKLGLVWMTQHTADGDLIWHNGMTGGFASFVGFTADHKHGVVILANRAMTVDRLGQATLSPSAAQAQTRATVPMTTAQLDEYTGAYQFTPDMVINVFRRDDQLLTQATGQNAFPVYPSATNEFFARMADISLSFTRDDHGKVNSMVVHQHGDHAAPRIGDAVVPKARKPVTLDAATLAGYAGRYQLAPGVIATVTVQDAQTFVQLTGQPAAPVYASAHDAFFYQVVDATIDFERDAKGQITGLVLHQNGKDLKATRLSQ